MRFSFGTAPSALNVLWLAAAAVFCHPAYAAESNLKSDHWAGTTITYVNRATAHNGIDRTSNADHSRSEQAVPPTAIPAETRALGQLPAKTSPVDQSSPVELSPIFVCAHDVTPAFVNLIAQDAKQLPESWKEHLANAGYRIVLSRTLFDSVPAAKGQQVRGYKSTARWSQIFGMFDRRKRRVVMAELAKRTEQEKSPLVALNDQQTRAGILRHEFGHAIDDYLKYPSHGRSFDQAYAAGLTRLNKSDKQVLKYYLQHGGAGKEEMFAELFATTNGIACDPVADKLLRQKFPEAMAVVEQTLGSRAGT